MLANYNGIIDFFNPSFIRDGFCVSGKDGPVYLQSHILCFFADTACTIVLWLLLRFYARGLDSSTLWPVESNLLGIFGHGMGHLSVGLGDDLKPESTY